MSTYLHSKLNEFKISKATIDDIPRIMELANKAFEENGSIGATGEGFKKKGRKRFKDSKSVEDILDILYVLKSIQPNYIIGVIGARIISDSKTVHISHLAIDTKHQVQILPTKTAEKPFYEAKLG